MSNNPAFVIGVFQQPQQNLAAWQARGANALCQIPTNGSTPWPLAQQQAWVAAAEQLGLWQLRVPVGDPAADAATNPHLMAFCQPDEPEGTGVSAATCAANYAAWKKAVPTKPVFMNFDGSRVLGIQGGLTQQSYAPYMPTADIMGSDIYPVSAWGQTTLNWLQFPGAAVARLASWSGGKPQYACIECSNQRIGPAIPGIATTAQIRYEVWNAVLNGATGIIWFPQQFNGFNFDGTTPAIQQEIARLNANLLAVGPFLAGAKPLAVASGFQCITNTVGNFTLLVNNTDQIGNYSGVLIAPYGAYAVANGQVIVQTPLPPSSDQLYDRLVNDESIIQRLITALGAAGNTLANP
jgi:hypothetical protein